MPAGETAAVPADEPVAAEEAAPAAGPVSEAQAEPEPEARARLPRPATSAPSPTLENFRKRARRDVGVAEARGMARVVRELLPALDNLERALAAAEAQPEGSTT